MKHATLAILCSFALLGLLPGCEEDNPASQSCDPAAAAPCPTGQACVATRSNVAECRPTCDPAATPTCAAGAICVPVAAAGAACVATCDPAAADPCGPDWRCTAAGDRGNICRRAIPPHPSAPRRGSPAAARRRRCLHRPVLPGRRPGLPGRAELRTTHRRPPRLLRPRRSSAASSTSPPTPASATPRLRCRRPAARSTAQYGRGRHVRADRARRAHPDGAPTPAAVPSPPRRRPGLRAVPRGVRVAPPIDVAASPSRRTARTVRTRDRRRPHSPAAPTCERGSISGTWSPTTCPGGAHRRNAGSANPPIGWADRSGAYVVFNADVGTYLVKGYKAFLQLETRSVMVDAGVHLVDVDLHELDTPTATVSGSIQIVNGGACDGTSVVLVPEETFDETLARGEVGTGLRAPTPPAEPTVSGAWTIDGVPTGTTSCWPLRERRVPATPIRHLRHPDRPPGRPRRDVAHDRLGESFKVTGALQIVPRRGRAQAVTAPVTFRWIDDRRGRLPPGRLRRLRHRDLAPRRHRLQRHRTRDRLRGRRSGGHDHQFRVTAARTGTSRP